MSNYSKLIAGIVGNLVAIVFAYFAFRGWGEVGPDGAITLFGMSQTAVTASLMLIVNAIFIERAPANKP